MIEFVIEPAQILQLLGAVVFPLLVGLVSTRVTSSGHKAVLLAALAFLTSLALELAGALRTGTSYDLGTALLLGLGTFLIAVGVHYGFWKPTGVTDKVLSAGRHAADTPPE